MDTKTFAYPFTIDLKDYNNNLSDSDLGLKLKEHLDDYGVVILKNFLSPELSEKYATSSIARLCEISEGLTFDPKTWTNNRLPYGPKWGMYQSIVGHFPEAWELREKIYPLFVNLWKEKELMTSIDGASIFPPKIIKTKDWPHIDQTVPELLSYQGQVVLTNTTASFRCTPKSNLYLTEILTALKVKKEDFKKLKNWYKFKEEETEIVKKVLQGKGVEDWQIPIHAPAGSVILWKSCTIHSAQRCQIIPSEEETKKEYNRWAGWRCVYYISQMPKKQYLKRHINIIKKAATTGRITGHWGNKTFAKKVGSQYGDKKINKIRELAEGCEKLSQEVELSETLQKLVGLKEY